MMYWLSHILLHCSVNSLLYLLIPFANIYKNFVECQRLIAELTILCEGID